MIRRQRLCASQGLLFDKDRAAVLARGRAAARDLGGAGS
jgi:hypothetical protein